MTQQRRSTHRHTCRTVNQSPRRPPPAPPVPSNDSSSVPQGQPLQETTASPCHPHPTSSLAQSPAPSSISVERTAAMRVTPHRFPNPIAQVVALTVPAAPSTPAPDGSQPSPVLGLPWRPCSGTLLRTYHPPASWTLTEQKGRVTKGTLQSLHVASKESGIRSQGCLLFGAFIAVPKTREHAPRCR